MIPVFPPSEPRRVYGIRSEAFWSESAESPYNHKLTPQIIYKAAVDLVKITNEALTKRVRQKQTMKPIISVILAACVALLSACSMSVTAKLYPVQGPLSEQKPIPVLHAHVKDVQRNSGDVTLTLPDGEICSGNWSSLAPQQVSMTSISGRGQITSGIQTAYATVYGTGFTVSNVSGVNRGTAYLVGDKGTTIEVEFFTGSGTASGNGVAIDSKGNICKVIF